MAKQQTTTDWLLLGGLIALWSSSFVFIEISLESFSPIGIVAVRILLGALVLSAVLLYKKLKLPTDWQSWGVLLIFGTFGTMLPFYLISVGQQSITSGMTGLLMAVMPLATMVLAHYFVPEESLNRYKLIGFATVVYFVIIGRAGPTFLANINYVIPVLAYFAGALLLGEVVEWSGLAALVLIVSGVAVTRYVPK